MFDVPVIIDDVEAACTHLSPLGRAVVEAACLSVRSVIRQFAIAHGWEVIEHARFADWIRTLVISGRSWLCLDPLIEPFEALQSIRSVRVSRILDGQQLRVDTATEEPLKQLKLGTPIGLIDDVAVSGSTLRHVVGLIRNGGGAVAAIALCTSTPVAHAAIAKQVPSIKWHQYAYGWRDTIHLRDACPYLPFSGRACAAQPPILTTAGHVPIRGPSILRKAGLWPLVFRDHRALVSSIRARSEVAVLFSNALGREATVGDLPLLGADIAVPAYPRHEVSAATTLASLC